MTAKSRSTKIDLAKSDAHQITAEEYDEIPELPDDFFERADMHQGGKLVRRGRPPSTAPKEAINIRLSADVLAYFRSTGPGWQTKIDAALQDIVKRGEKAKA